MNRTIVGRITLIRGARQQIETYIRQITELGPLGPLAVPVLLFIFVRSYQDEQKKMLAERTQVLKQEKQAFDKVERQLVRELQTKSTAPGRLRRLLPRRVQRAS